MSAQGLDVSNYQGRFDWRAAKARIPDLAFGIYKMTQGIDFTDGDAQWNHDEIGSVGITHGAYHYLDPAHGGEAQANYFIAQHHAIGLSTTDMLWLDHEKAGSSPAATAACGVAFMRELDLLAPHNPRGVYTYINFARTGYCAGLGDRPLWMAYPASREPAAPMPWTRATFWQWGTRNGDDADAFNGTVADLHAWIRKFQPSAGPYRHLFTGNETLAQVAAGRNTTPEHLWKLLCEQYTAADLAVLAGLVIPADVPYYTTNP